MTKCESTASELAVRTVSSLFWRVELLQQHSDIAAMFVTSAAGCNSMLAILVQF